MKINFAYLFAGIRRLLEIPPERAGGEPGWKITVKIRKP